MHIRIVLKKRHPSPLVIEDLALPRLSDSYIYCPQMNNEPHIARTKQARRTEAGKQDRLGIIAILVRSIDTSEREKNERANKYSALCVVGNYENGTSHVMRWVVSKPFWSEKVGENHKKGRKKEISQKIVERYHEKALDHNGRHDSEGDPS